MYGIRVSYPKYDDRDGVCGYGSYMKEMTYINPHLAGRLAGKGDEDSDLYFEVINLVTGERWSDRKEMVLPYIAVQIDGDIPF